MSSPRLVITSKRGGFRRAGIAHPDVPTEHPAGAFSDAQLAALQAEPMLRVELPDPWQPADGNAYPFPVGEPGDPPGPAETTAKPPKPKK